MFVSTPHAADFRVPEMVEAMRNLSSRGRILTVEYKRDRKTAYMLQEAE